MSDTTDRKDLPGQDLPSQEGYPENIDRKSSPGQEPLPLEGYLEHTESITPETTINTITPPTLNGDEAEPHPPDAGPQPTPPLIGQEKNLLRNLPNWKKRALFACSCLLPFLLQFDMAAVAVLWNQIAQEENAPLVKTFAMATGYFLAQTVFQLVFSHVSHVLGRKCMFLTGLFLYLVGAAIAVSGPPIDLLVIARVVQGIGAAGMFTMSAIVLVELTQPRQRAGWTSITAAFGALGNICGPLVAGLLCKHHHFTWRSIFGIEIFIACALLGLLGWLLPNESSAPKNRLRELKGCDWIGMLFFFACSVGILVPVNIGGTGKNLGWSSGPVILCFLIGVFSLISLVCHQRCLAKRPVFPREVFERRTTNVAFFGNAICGVLLSMVFYSLVLFWEGVRAKSMMEVGKMLLSVTLTYPVAVALTGFSIKRHGRITWATCVGGGLATLGLGLMYFMTETTPEAHLVIICVLAAAGCGIFTPAMINSVLATTDSRWHAHAIATRTLLYTAGQCIGVSGGLAIFTNTFSRSFDAVKGEKAPFAEATRQVMGNPQELMSKIRELQQLTPNGEVAHLVDGALRHVWETACVLAGVTTLLAIAYRSPRLAEDRRTGSVVPDEERQNSTEMTQRS